MGRRRWGQQLHGRVWQAVRCPSVPPSRLAGCSSVISSTVAFGMQFVDNHVHRRIWQADREPAKRPGAIGSRIAIPTSGRVPRGAPQHSTITQRSVAAHRRGTLSRCWRMKLLASRRRTEAGTHTAHRFACFVARRGARPHPTVAPCQSAYRFTDWNAVFHRAPRPTRHCS